MKTKCKHCNGTGKVEAGDIELRQIRFETEVFDICSQNYKELKIGTEIAKEFIDYWTERNTNGIRMRLEMEKVFNIKRRLKTWSKNDKQWNPNQEEPKIVVNLKLPKKAEL